MAREKEKGTNQMKWKNLNQSKWLEQYYKLKISILKFQLKKYSKALKKLRQEKKS